MKTLTVKQIGNLIKKQRKSKKMSYHAAAKIVGTSQSHYTAIENGDINYTLEYYLKVCDALGIVVSMDISGKVVKVNEPKKETKFLKIEKDSIFRILPPLDKI